MEAINSLVISILLQLFGPQQATMLFAGDAMMHKGQLTAAQQSDGSYDYSDYFAAFAPEIAAADYAVVNLETPLGGKPYSGYPCFCAPDSYADAIRDAGFDMCLTANNHTLDRRDRGLKRTIDVLNDRGLDHLGTYRDAAQRDSVMPLIREVNGFRVGFLNYTYGTNGINIQGDVVVDYIDRELIASDIRAAREKGAELVCVAIHWGDEYHLLPNDTQRRLADFLVEQGVELVIGGHPHVIQPMEMRTDSEGRKHLVVYSLGNFISDMKKRDTRGGAMVTVGLSRDENGVAQVDTASYSLVFTVPGGAGKNFRLIDPDDVASCPAAYRVAARDFATSARSIFDKHNIDVPEAKN